MGKNLSSVAVVFGQRVRNIRDKRGWTQDELAEKADLSQAHLSAVERGAKFPSAETIETLARVLGVPFYELFVDVGDHLRHHASVTDEAVATLEDEIGRLVRAWLLRTKGSSD